MSRDVRLWLEDIRDAGLKILDYSKGVDFPTFLADRKTFDAVVRNLGVIGEAVKQLPEDFKVEYPGVDWKRIAGLRDVVIHGYFGVDPGIIWDIVASKVPGLLQEVELILANLE